MAVTALAVICLLLAAIPATLFVRNVALYRPLPRNRSHPGGVSVLIPARNEAERIGAAIESIQRATLGGMEIVVLDDSSSDSTPEVVAKMRERDGRIRLIRGQPLPAGWCGKNFACQQLAEAAQYPLLIFMDADVRVSRPDALVRLACFLQASEVSLVSGVPRQETESWLEKLIVPLIHFVLLGFLPLGRMRASTDSNLAAACGQILAVRRSDYLRTGGHGAVAGKIHDAVALTRNFRAHGLRTDLFDATDTFSCRMYTKAREVWAGFAKNAHEGLGSRKLIGPATAILLLGQVLPVTLIVAGSGVSVAIGWMALLVSLLPRVVAAVRFRQPIGSALLHPLSILLLLGIQWDAFARKAAGRSVRWKARAINPDALTTAVPPVPR